MHSRRVSTLLLSVGVVVGGTLFGAPSTALALDVPIVYVRAKRITTPITITDEVTVGGVTSTKSRTFKYTDIYSPLPDVTRFYGNFAAPLDLVYRAPDGTERVLYDCTSKSTEESACAATDPAVSFDGKTIAFTLFSGSLEHLRDAYSAKTIDPAAENDFGTKRVTLPAVVLRSTDAQIMLVDVATGKITELPHTKGVFDSGPAWLSNGRIAFTSTRAQHFSTLVFGSTTSIRVSQTFTMDPDGKNVEAVSHHALASEQHPLQLLDGRVAYASWQLFGRLPFRTTNGSPGGFGTLHNFFHVYVQSPDGANQFAIFGQHTVNKNPAHVHDAAHFFAQTTDGRLFVADYYRNNNNGLGTIHGFTIPPEGQEGRGPDEPGTTQQNVYLPRDIFTLTQGYGTQSDDVPKKLATPFASAGYTEIVRAGKVGHPAALPNNGLMITFGLGSCFNYGNQFTSVIKLELDAADQPGCDTGIYRLTKIPSTSPTDLELVVNDPEYHEFMSRAVVPYRDIYGVDAPVLIPRPETQAAAVAPLGVDDLPPGTPYGVLGASSMIYRETKPVGGIAFESEHGFALQGTDTIDYGDDEICGLRILGVQPNREKEYGKLFAPAGERVVVLGEIPVRNYGPDGKPVVDVQGNHDTSFRVRIPADTPYLMQAIDCKGRTLNTDQTWQHMVPGEQKVCGGCHVHGKEGLDFGSTFAARADYVVRRLGDGEVPLLAGGSGTDVKINKVPGQAVSYEFMRDVFPILQTRCVSCHGGAAPAAGLALDVPGTGAGSTWARLAADKAQANVPEAFKFNGRYGTRLGSPNLSKYVRFMNARGSLLYWKAANERTDNRTDATYTDAEGTSGRKDVDFGAAHPTSITADELAVIGRWIDTGAMGGQDAVLDTTPPALTLVGKAEGEAIVTLYVGMTDAPSGIDPESLEVCVLDAAGACAKPLAVTAVPNGVATIKLEQPMTDGELRARVKDLAGNETVVEKTVRRLLALPPPPPPGGGDPGLAPDGGAGAGPDGGEQSRGGCGCLVPGQSSDEASLRLALVALVGSLIAWRSRRGRRPSA